MLAARPFIVLAALAAACQTPSSPPSPAVDPALVGPNASPTILQRAANGTALAPAAPAAGHDHHRHHGAAPTQAP